MTAPTVLLDPPHEIVRWLQPQHPSVTVRNLRQWAKRGHITRHPGDLYDAVQVADYLDHRPDPDTRRSTALVARSHDV